VIGRAKLLAEYDMTVDAELAGQCREWEEAGRTAVLVGWDGRVRGAIAVADTVKPSAAAVSELRQLGLHPVLLTGDSEATAGRRRRGGHRGGHRLHVADGAAEKVKEASDAIARLVRS
jgi:cation transport ATPase